MLPTYKPDLPKLPTLCKRLSWPGQGSRWENKNCELNGSKFFLNVICFEFLHECSTVSFPNVLNCLIFKKSVAAASASVVCFVLL